MPDACRECGRRDGRGGQWCARCYMRRYRATEIRRARASAIAAASVKRHQRDPGWRAKRRRWVRAWQERVGLFVPDLGELRRAINRLEYAVAETTDRQAVRGADQ